MCSYTITLPESNQILTGSSDQTLLKVLQQNGLSVNAPCGGNGKCGKCRVFVNSEERLACQTPVDRDMTIRLNEVPDSTTVVLTEGIECSLPTDPVAPGYLAAFDIGTTTVAGYLLSPSGQEVACSSALNPQSSYGADVISRIQAARTGQSAVLRDRIRSCISQLLHRMCDIAAITPDEISVLSLVANPCMQQLFLDISVDNLVTIPFHAVINRTDILPASDFLPELTHASLLLVPDISGYVGADTIGCMIATQIDRSEEMTLLVDIGTNGEMVLGNRDHLVACSTAAGPALEGARIHFGMRAAQGAIDHVWLEDEQIHIHVIGDTEAIGICGSGLIDAIAAFLDMGMINKRGRILTEETVDEERILRLSETVYLTQQDIREFQMAKGAIASGIYLMAEYLEISPEDIQHVYLAGAFGSFIDARRACRIGLLPGELIDRIRPVGNAAGSGSKLIAANRHQFRHCDALIASVHSLELASLPGFRMTFAKCMNFTV